jgi:hypothetical protein
MSGPEPQKMEVNHTNCGRTCGICVVPDYPCLCVPRPSPTGEGKEARPETEGEVCQECESIMLARHEAEKARLKEHLCDEQAETFMAWWREAEAIGENIHLHQANSALRLRVEELERERDAVVLDGIDWKRRALEAESERAEWQVQAADYKRQAELATALGGGFSEALMAAERRAEEAEKERDTWTLFERDTFIEAFAALRRSLDYHSHYVAHLLKQTSKEEFEKIAEEFAYEPASCDPESLSLKVTCLLRHTKDEFALSDLAEIFRCDEKSVSKALSSLVIPQAQSNE